MRSLQLTEVGHPLEEVDIDVDPPNPLDVIVKVEAAGICHSDIHYRSGPFGPTTLPMTLGHEVAGTIVAVGDGVVTDRIGERVCLHYLTFCGECRWCLAGSEQFCASSEMLGNSRPGGYAEFITVPSVNAVPLPEEIPFEHGAVMMCSSATSFHGLRKARLQPGETVVVFGTGGLGMSAIQIARSFEAAEVFAVDLSEDRLAMASDYGATPVTGGDDAVDAILDATDGKGVDVALEVIGLGPTMKQALDVLGPRGRAAVVGLSSDTIEIAPYQEMIGREAELIGVSDHLLSEIPEVLGLYLDGALRLDRIVGLSVPLDGLMVNDVMDRVQAFGGAVRTVITP